jgi:Ca-activated chloride channel family protein
MDIDLSAFHFLRPGCLLLIPAGVLVMLVWHWLSDPRRRWQGVIAAKLLRRLIVDDSRRWRWRPVHLIAVALALLGVATAGPTWEQEVSPFSEDQAPLIVALDLSRSMDAVDIPPTRLERAKQKILELMKLRAGSRTGLVVYAGTAHMVMPPTDDPEFMDTFLAALATSLMPSPGKNALAALDIATGLLARERAAGTVLFITDGFDAPQVAPFAARARQGTAQVLVLAVGTAPGGPLRGADGRVATDAGGHPLRGGFDLAALKRLAAEADVPLASLALDDDDVQWVQRRAVTHMQAAEQRQAPRRWKEAGWWLAFPIVLLAAFWFRRGWVVRWMPVLVLAAWLPMPHPAQAADVRVIDAFLTPDQQGRRLFERGDYAAAASRFADPMWQGWAYWRAGDYANALTAFAHLETPEAYLMMGNCNARLKDYPRALAAYDNALKQRPGFAQARANRALVAALIPKPAKDKDDPQEEKTEPEAGETVLDTDEKKGKLARLERGEKAKQDAELWMRNLQVSPADFLRQKFQMEAASAPKGRP